MSIASPMQLSRAVFLLAGLFALFVTAATGHAQGVQPTTGVIEGRVTDREGNAIEDAVIHITGASERKVRVDQKGFYRSDQLLLGVYGVEAQAGGHVSSLFEGMRLRPGETLRLDFRLAEGKPTSFSMTRMPVVDTRARGARYWLTREDLERLPSGGISRPLFSLLPRSEVVLFDETELAVPRSESTGTLGLSLERLPPELLSSVTMSSADSTPAQRSSDRLQLLTRSSQSPLHGSLLLRYSNEDLQGRGREGLPRLERAARPTVALGGVPHDRYRLFGAWSRHRETQQLPEVDLLDLPTGLAIERIDRTRLGRLDFGPPERWELRLLWLQTRGEVDLAGSQNTADQLFAGAERRLSGVALERVTEGRLGYTFAVREDRIELASRAFDDPARQLRSRQNRELSWYGEIHRGRHLIGVSAGLLDSEVRIPTRRDRLDSLAFGIEDRWTLGRRWLAYLGVRAQHLREAPQGAAAAVESTVVDPRVSLAFDYGADGQLGFRISAGRERWLRPTFLERFQDPDGSVPTPTDRDALQPAVEFVALGARYQLVPGLTMEGELSRRDRERPRNAGDEASRIGDIDVLEGLIAGTFSALSELRLDEFFGEENRFRFQTESRIGRKLTGWALYELRDFEEGVDRDGEPFELGTVQHLRVTSAYRFENGIGFGGVFRYIDGYGVAAPRVGALTIAGSDETLESSTSLAQVDVSFDYRPQILTLGVLGDVDLILRLEVLNALDRRNVPVSVAALDGTGEAAGLALIQEPRAIWFGVGMEF